jgi:hypothetical protein
VQIVAAAAAFENENDNAEAQRAMNVLRDLSRATGAFVLGLDHYGKEIGPGTRGASAKEAAADMVLALLGDKDAAGNVAKTRMALRKCRSGPQGIETPYTLQMVDLGADQDGDRITTRVVAWGVPGAPVIVEKPPPRMMRLLEAVINDTDTESIKLPDKGIEVRAVRLADVREEFMAEHPGEKANAKRTAFRRALKTAMADGSVRKADIAGEEWLWEPATQSGGQV